MYRNRQAFCCRTTQKAIDKFIHLLVNRLRFNYLYCKNLADFQSIFVFVEEEVFFGGVVGPDVFDAFVGVALVLDFLEVLDDFEGCARTHRVVYELVLGGGPGSVFKFGSQFKCPIHSSVMC